MNWLRNFMYGRRGIDALGMALLALSFVLLIASRFIFSGVFSTLALLALIYCYYRALSRDLYKRAAENDKFSQFCRPLYGWFASLITRIQENKTYCHFKCRSCGQKMRVPRGHGKVSVTCPRCGAQTIKDT